MNITVFGAGNLGLACCAVLSQDNDVTLYTTRPHKSRETLAYTYEEKAVGIGRPSPLPTTWPGPATRN